jgi:hypothetical protein
VAEPETKLTGKSVPAFIKTVDGAERQKDCATLVRMMKAAAGAPAKMWGTSIVGFGSYDITYADGRTAGWPTIAFSPRQQDLTLYLRASKAPAAMLNKLGKHKVSGGCLHIKRLSDVDLTVLASLASLAVKART